jgi:hypothetical protein
MGERIQVTSGFRHERREVEVEVGKEYVVQPMNPQKTKNRGRKCVILDFVPLSESHPNDMVAKVRYLDNNRVGRAELSDLLPA